MFQYNHVLVGRRYTMFILWMGTVGDGGLGSKQAFGGAQSAGWFAACGRETMVRQACLWKTSQNNIHSSSQEACQKLEDIRVNIKVCWDRFVRVRLGQANARHVKLHLFFAWRKVVITCHSQTPMLMCFFVFWGCRAGSAADRVFTSYWCYCLRTNSTVRLDQHFPANLHYLSSVQNPGGLG